jgi:hypothetical protein
MNNFSKDLAAARALVAVYEREEQRIRRIRRVMRRLMGGQ